MDVRETGRECINRIHVAEDKDIDEFNKAYVKVLLFNQSQIFA